MLVDIVTALRCPYCHNSLTLSPAQLGCENGHRFDLARQGYVNLTRSTVAPQPRGDTAAMVAARQSFLARGHFTGLQQIIVDTVAACASSSPEARTIIDAGAGTGYFLGAILHRLPGHLGIALDASKYALRRAAQAHSRLGAVGCNLWDSLPVTSSSAALILNVFAPRNPPEFRRILRADGHLLIVTPGQDHLAELAGPLGLLAVDPHKQLRLQTELARDFRRITVFPYQASLTLAVEDVITLVGMGPNAFHLRTEEVKNRVSSLWGDNRTVSVTLSVLLSVYRPL